MESQSLGMRHKKRLQACVHRGFRFSATMLLFPPLNQHPPSMHCLGVETIGRRFRNDIPRTLMSLPCSVRKEPENSKWRPICQAKPHRSNHQPTTSSCCADLCAILYQILIKWRLLVDHCNSRLLPPNSILTERDPLTRRRRTHIHCSHAIFAFNGQYDGAVNEPSRHGSFGKRSDT